MDAGKTFAECVLNAIQQDTAIHALGECRVVAAVPARAFDKITSVVVEFLGQRLAVFHYLTFRSDEIWV